MCAVGLARLGVVDAGSAAALTRLPAPPGLWPWSLELSGTEADGPTSEIKNAEQQRLQLSAVAWLLYGWIPLHSLPGGITLLRPRPAWLRFARHTRLWLLFWHSCPMLLPLLLLLLARPGPVLHAASVPPLCPCPRPALHALRLLQSAPCLVVQGPGSSGGMVPRGYSGGMVRGGGQGGC